MDGAVKTPELVKINKLDAIKWIPNIDLGFAICNSIKVVKKNGKINYTKIANFKIEAKNIYAHLANDIATKILIQLQFAGCARALNPINMARNPESCKKHLDVILEKLVATKHFTLSIGDECKQEYGLFLSTIVKEEKSNFQKFYSGNTRRDVFFMTYLQDNV